MVLFSGIIISGNSQLYNSETDLFMFGAFVMWSWLSQAQFFSIIKAGFYKCQSYGQITLNCSMMERKNAVWIRAPVETKQKNLIAIRVL